MITVSMVSLTYANKSKKALENFGYSCNIIHKVQATGCEYIITVDAPKEKVIRILNEYQIPIKKVS